MIYVYMLGAAIMAGIGFYGGLRVGMSETEGWIEQAAAMEAQLHQMQTDGDARAKRAEAVAAQATAALAKVRKEAEADRAKWIAEATDGWTAYLDGQRVRPAAGDDAAALAACRSDEAAARGALRVVLDAAFAIRGVAVVNTEQLKALQQWVQEASK